MAFDPYISIPAPIPGKPAAGKPIEIESLNPAVATPRADQTVPAENKTEA